MNIIGRHEIIAELNEIQHSRSSEFVVIYGRRRIGKTYLINEYFENNFSFQITGLANETKRMQLCNFREALIRHSGEKQITPKNWMMAFNLLITYLESLPKSRKVLFFDEMPWMAEQGTGFVSALEHFWNGWANLRKDIVLIVCGSATSWITNKIINNKGGLYNRVTRKIFLQPFTLNETEQFLQNRHINFPRKDIVELYMIMGGVPYYLDLLKPSLSLTQNIDNLCFTERGSLLNEFNNLYAALWRNSNWYVKVVEAIASKSKGLTREEIRESTKLNDNGNTTRILKDLENCSFIRRYNDIQAPKRRCLYQLTDPFTLFYFHFLKNFDINEDTKWLSMIGTPQHNTWAGYAFEGTCFLHIKQIKKTLGIANISTKISSWRDTTTDGRGDQIDMIIDRKDNAINLCEIKFYEEPFRIDKTYRDSLDNKIAAFKKSGSIRAKKTIFLTFITTFGLVANTYSSDIYHRIEMNDLFEKI